MSTEMDRILAAEAKYPNLAETILRELREAREREAEEHLRLIAEADHARDLADLYDETEEA